MLYGAPRGATHRPQFTGLSLSISISISIPDRNGDDLQSARIHTIFKPEMCNAAVPLPSSRGLEVKFSTSTPRNHLPPLRHPLLRGN